MAVKEAWAIGPVGLVSVEVTFSPWGRFAGECYVRTSQFPSYRFDRLTWRWHCFVISLNSISFVFWDLGKASFSFSSVFALRHRQLLDFYSVEIARSTQLLAGVDKDGSWSGSERALSVYPMTCGFPGD